MGKCCFVAPGTLLGLLCATVSPAAAAEDPNRMFESLFGQEAEKVERSPTKKDDVALAEKLLTADDVTDAHERVRRPMSLG